MKRFLILTSLFIIVGCSNGEDSKPKVDNNQETERVDSTEKSDVTIKFGGIDVVTERDVILVTGEVKSTEDVFYYTLEYGEEVIVEETEIEVGKKVGEWNIFTLEINIADKNLTNEELPLLTFYVKDDQKVINPNYVPVDLMIY